MTRDELGTRAELEQLVLDHLGTLDNDAMGLVDAVWSVLEAMDQRLLELGDRRMVSEATRLRHHIID